MNKLLLVVLYATGAIASANNNLFARQTREATCQDIIDLGLQGWTCCKDGTTPCDADTYCSLGENDTQWACCPNGVVCGNGIGNGDTLTKTTEVTATQVDEAGKTTTAVEYPVETTSSVVEPSKSTSSEVPEPPKDTTSAAVKPPKSTESSVYVPPATTTVPVPTPGSNGTKPDTTPIPTVVSAGSSSGPSILGGLLAGAMALFI